MSMRRGSTASARAVPTARRAPAAVSACRRQSVRLIPRQAISVVSPPPPGISWRAIGTSAALGLLLIVSLSLAGLAFRPRDPRPDPAPLQPVSVAMASAPVAAPPGPAAAPPVPIAIAAVKVEVQAPAVVDKQVQPPAPPVPVERVPIVRREVPVSAPAPVETASKEEAPAEPPALPQVLKPAEPEPKTCGTCGTSVAFVGSPAMAKRRATEEGKLLFTLHVSGNFEDPGFT